MTQRSTSPPQGEAAQGLAAGDRLLPTPAPTADRSIEAEQSVLGGLLLDNSAWAVAAQLLTPADFSEPDHAAIYSAIGHEISSGDLADVITVFERLKAQGRVGENCGLAYLNALAQSVPSAANLRRYAEIVRERAMLRRLRDAPSVDAARAVLQRADDDAGEGFALLAARDVAAMPAAPWLVKGLLPATGIAAIYGPSTSGKSFLCLDLATAIAEGRVWFGHRVRQQPVAYVVLEGHAGIPQRLAAWERHHERPLPEGLRFSMQPFALIRDVPELARSIVRTLGPGCVVFIDTLNAATTGADENTARDMGMVIDAARELARLVGGLVVLVGHTGRDEERGLRGHSSQFAALDAGIQTTRTATARSWTAAKVKDGADGEVHAFRLRTVHLGRDDDGDDISSAVIEADDGTATEALQRMRLPRGGNQRIALDALKPMFKASSAFGRAGAPAHRPCIELEAAVTEIAKAMTCEPKRRSTRAREAVNGLVSGGVMSCREGWLWLN